MKSYIAGPNEEGVRLSRFVQSVAKTLPTGLLYKGLRNKRIKVNGKRAAADTRLHQGDQIELYLNDEFFEPAAPAPRQAKRLPLTMIYEDDALAVLYKPAHLLCHSDRTGDPSLIDAFIARQIEQGAYQPEQEAAFRPALCNRLDRGTEGLVLAAKTYPALRDLNGLIRAGLLHKEYLAITCGAPPQGIHVAYLRHDEKHNRVTVRSGEAPGYKQIITQVQLVKRADPFCLCRIGLITGRTHQIRAHLAFLNAPILGDIKYGSQRMNKRTGSKTQALCAVSLRFDTLPPENTLHSLSQKTIELPHPAILTQFETLASGRTGGQR